MSRKNLQPAVLFSVPDSLLNDCLEALLATLPCHSRQPQYRNALLRELDNFDANLVLLDDSHGEQELIQLSHALRRRRPQLSIAVATSDWQASEGARLKAAGVDHILRKPFGAARLLALFETVQASSKETTCSVDA